MLAMLNTVVAEPHHNSQNDAGDPRHDEEGHAGLGFAVVVAGCEAGVFGGLADDREDHRY